MGNKFGLFLTIHLLLTVIGALGQYTFPSGGAGEFHNKIDKDNTIDPYFGQNFPYWVDGTSKDGRVVYTIPFGKWDIAGKASNRGRSNEFRDYVASSLDDVKQAINKANQMHPDKPEVKKAICIVDWDGFDWSQLLNAQAVVDISEFVRIYEENFQGSFSKVFYINCDDSITKFLALLSKLLDPDSMKTLTVHNDTEAGQKEILQLIDADQIRPAFGGTKDKNKIEEIKAVDPYFRQNFPYWVDGMSKDGRPVYTVPFGKWDIAGKVTSKDKSDDFKDYLFSSMDEVKRAIKITTELNPGKPEVAHAIFIIDWDGFDWSQTANFKATYDILEFARMYEKQYSGTCGKAFYINCADSILKLTILLQPILAPDTMQKITVHNTDKETWQKEILQYIDADQIRPAFGGTKDNDENPFVTNSTIA